ncbi:cell division protein FtsA [bacterium]|nr:cell division protein FtsA [bacterium]
MVKKDNIICGLDIGTTKISAVIADHSPGSGVEIIGMGVAPSRGLKKGIVIDIDSTVESIKYAVREAELMSGEEINSVYVGIAGGHIRGINGKGVIAISGKNKEIVREDIDRALDAAKAMNLPANGHEVLHVIPQEYIIDNQDGIKQPLGMSGISRLEVCVHIVTNAVTSAQNIIKCVNKAGMEVKDIVLEQLGSSQSTITQEEKDLGIAVVDIGGGTTDIAIFIDGSIRHTSVLSLAGDNFTKDIAVGIRTPISSAEKIKKEYGCAMTSLVEEDEVIEVPSVGGRKPRVISRQVLSEIIQPRAEEILDLIAREIHSSGYEDLIPAGVVLTGGASIMEGMVELAEQIFDLPVRVGYPNSVGGLKDIVKSPIHATGVGLVLYGAMNRNLNRRQEYKSSFYGIASRVRTMVNEFLVH